MNTNVSKNVNYILVLLSESVIAICFDAPEKCLLVMNTQGEKCVDSHAERVCLFRLHRRQESWSQAGNGHTQVGKQAGESQLGLKANWFSQRARTRLSRVKTNNTS